MRSHPTDAERRLWTAIRLKQLGGARFRRQQPIGPYIVDFFCPDAGLVVELDGDQHGSDANSARDAIRTAWLQERGYIVVRFANWRVLKELSEVIEEIVHVLENPPHPTKAALRLSSTSPSRGEVGER